MLGGKIDGERLPLLHLEGRLTGRVYVERILEGHVVPFITSTENPVILQQDNAQPHRAIVTREFCV